MTLERDNQFFRRLLADYERLVAPSSEVPLPLTVELWIVERLRTALDLVQNKSSAKSGPAKRDLEGWIEDARYWRMIVERFSESVPKESSPPWLLRARAQGRAEFLDMLLDQSAETFADDYTGSHSLGESGDYGTHWESDKLRELFKVDDASFSLIDNLGAMYWSQQARIGDLELANENDARDAARYRFLRQKNHAIVYARDPNAWGINSPGHVRYDTPEQLDAAIDAALTIGPTKGEEA